MGMTREATIKHLENMKWLKGYDNTTVNGVPLDSVIDDIIALLKAQEPVEPTIDTHWETPSVYDDDVKVTENKCGACGAEIDKWDKYCRVCGRAVKWE